MLQSMVKDSSLISKDIGYLMLSYLDFYSTYEYNFNYLNEISDQSMKYYSYLYGLKENDDQKAIYHFNKEIENNGFLEGSVNKLYALFYKKSDNIKIAELVENGSLSCFLSRSKKKEFFFKANFWKNY